jgi:hypothetical protein
MLGSLDLRQEENICIIDYQNKIKVLIHRGAGCLQSCRIAFLNTRDRLLTGIAIQTVKYLQRLDYRHKRMRREVRNMCF